MKLERNTAYQLDDIVYTYSGIKLKCSVAGTTSTNPFVLSGTTIIDGTVTWEVQSTELPIATENILGGIKVGSNLSITQDGVLSITGGSGGGEGINIQEDFEYPSFTVPDKTYGYVTNVYFKDMLTGQYICESEDIVITYKTHLCCIYVKYKQGVSGQRTSNNYPSVVSGITLPPNEIVSGYLRLTTSGEIWAMGAHSAGSVYDGLALYSYTQTIKTSK